MEKIIWTAKADLHLQQINIYISSFSAFYAQRFLKDLILHVNCLLKYPLIGKIYYEGVYTYRRILYKNYIIIYRVEKKIIYINAVYHQHKKITKDDFI